MLLNKSGQVANHNVTGSVMCPYCGVGCLVDVKTSQNKVISLQGTLDADRYPIK